MKLLFFIFFISTVIFSQDTLNCKKDLTWDKVEKFYYKTTDLSKGKYTGPAKCYPQKGVENRGFLKDGAWEGKVYGYKGNIFLGFATFSNGYYNGLSVKYYENGMTRDSSIYDMGRELYSKIIKRDKRDLISTITERFSKNDTTIIKMYDYYNEQPSTLTISRYFNNKKNGNFESFLIEEDENLQLKNYAESTLIFKDNVLIAKRKYDYGELFMEEQFVDGKTSKIITFYGKIENIESEAPYVKGKIHGEKKYFDLNGKLSAIEKFENGKSIEMIEY